VGGGGGSKIEEIKESKYELADSGNMDTFGKSSAQLAARKLVRKKENS
jgi:hypothetical protein